MLKYYEHLMRVKLKITFDLYEIYMRFLILNKLCFIREIKLELP